MRIGQRVCKDLRPNRGTYNKDSVPCRILALIAKLAPGTLLHGERTTANWRITRDDDFTLVVQFLRIKQIKEVKALLVRIKVARHSLLPKLPRSQSKDALASMRAWPLVVVHDTALPAVHVKKQDGYSSPRERKGTDTRKYS